jgi:hypothetical protein
MARYVVATEDNQFYIDPYSDDAPCVFTSKETAQETARSMPGGFMAGADRTLIKVNPWKVYELVEVNCQGAQ